MTAATTETRPGPPADDTAAAALARSASDPSVHPEGSVVGFFTTKQKIGRLLWGFVQATLFRWSPRRANNWRAMLLRCFGAKVGRPRVLRNTARFEVPWNVVIGEGARIGDGAYFYSLGTITVGDHAVISQFAHLCAGTHEHESTAFTLVRVPLSIGDYAWIGTDVYVAPGVTIGDGVIVGARSNVVKDLPAWRICVGSPAKAIRPRILSDHTTGKRLDTNTDEVPEPPQRGETA